MIANGYGVSLGSDENALKLIIIVAQLCKYADNYCTLQMGEIHGISMNYIAIKLLLKLYYKCKS